LVEEPTGPAARPEEALFARFGAAGAGAAGADTRLLGLGVLGLGVLGPGVLGLGVLGLGVLGLGVLGLELLWLGPGGRSKGALVVESGRAGAAEETAARRATGRPLSVPATSHTKQPVTASPARARIEAVRRIARFSARPESF
jgi:hypothetical protein